MNAFMGIIGSAVIIGFITISYMVFALKVKPESFGMKLPSFLKFMKHKEKDIVVPSDDVLSDSENETESGSETEIPELKSTSGKDNKKEPVEFIVRTTKQYEEDTDIDEDDEIPEVVPTGSIIRDFDNDKKPVAHSEEVPLNITRPEAVDTLPDPERTQIRKRIRQF
jgi:hypothetical protein